MRWLDRVHGDSAIEDEGILRLIACPTFERLRGIRQAGPSVFAHPFKTVTRFEHSLGVFLLLHCSGPIAANKSRVSCTIFRTPHFRTRSISSFRRKNKITTNESSRSCFIVPISRRRSKDSVFTLRNLSTTRSFRSWNGRFLRSADRIDYFLRDGLVCGVVPAEFPAEMIRRLAVFDGAIVMTDRRVAAEAVELFSIMNRDWWAGPTESYIYNEFADALREGFRLGVLSLDDLLTDDDRVLSILTSSKSPLILQKLDHINTINIDRLTRYVPKISPKTRWLDPPLLEGGTVAPLSARENQV